MSMIEVRIPGSPRPFQTVATHVTAMRMRVAVSGEVDLATAPRLRDVCLSLLADHRPEVLDVCLEGVSFLDCAGMNALVAVRAGGRKVGCVTWISCPQPHVARVLRIAGLLSAFTAPTGSVLAAA